MRSELCYHTAMQKPSTEPSVLQIFRLYAWVQLASIFLLSLVDLLVMRFHPQPPPGVVLILRMSVNQTLPMVFLILASLGLLVYLYSPWLQKRLSRFFIPSALVFALLLLIVEQHLFLASIRSPLQVSPFMFILLILVAWQYDYRAVVYFTLGTAGLDIIFNIFYPPMIYFMPPGEPVRQDLGYGLIISRSMAFLVLGYVVNRLAQAQRKQSRELAEANQKLVRHAATLEQLATSRERVRLSRELHDTLAHTLSAQTVQIEAVLTTWQNMPEKARTFLENMLATAQSGLDETRRALRSLRASPLEELGLAGAIRTLAEDFAYRNRLVLEMDIPEQPDDLAPEVEQCFYRVAQETLENVARHAGADHFFVQLTEEYGKLELTITDNGVGFNQADISDDQRMGLQGMHERAELIGATLQIESQPGAGTEVHLRLERQPEGQI
jgi:signal transduction histidine kinase